MQCQMESFVMTTQFGWSCIDNEFHPNIVKIVDVDSLCQVMHGPRPILTVSTQKVCGPTNI